MRYIRKMLCRLAGHHRSDSHTAEAYYNTDSVVYYDSIRSKKQKKMMYSHDFLVLYNRDSDIGFNIYLVAIHDAK